MLYKIYRLPVELYGKSVYADMYFIIGKGGGNTGEKNRWYWIKEKTS